MLTGTQSGSLGQARRAARRAAGAGVSWSSGSLGSVCGDFVRRSTPRVRVVDQPADSSTCSGLAERLNSASGVDLDETCWPVDLTCGRSREP